MGPSALLDLSARASGRVAKNRARGRRPSALFAEGRVLYFSIDTIIVYSIYDFSRQDRKRVRINPIVHEGAMALIDL